MARDRKNFYQLTPAQIRSKIKKFRLSPVAWSWYENDRSDRKLPPLKFPV